jgi:hypothetical protein
LPYLEELGHSDSGDLKKRVKAEFPSLLAIIALNNSLSISKQL